MRSEAMSWSDDQDEDHEAGLLHRALVTLALGGLFAFGALSVQRTHARRRDERPAALPEREQAWEGEGGRPDPDPNPGLPASDDVPGAARG